VSLHPHNLAQKAEVIVEHFRRATATKIGGQAKAMVVTRSRLHAVRYKQAVDALIAEKGYVMRTLVAFSGTVVDGGVDYTESQLNGFPESQLPERFASDDYALLIVAEKYQTGYDQPLLHTMYVDKKLEGVKAVQTLSRLNRIHAGKDDTFVLDFANEPDDIQRAFKPFFEATIAEPTNPNLVYNAQTALEAFGVVAARDVDAFAVAFLEAGGGHDIHASLYRHLDPGRARFLELDSDQREEFRSALTRFLRVYAFLAQIVPYGDPELEKLYLYGRFLSLRLPREAERGLDLSDDVVLTHLRTQFKSDRDLSLGEGDGKLPGFTGDATGPQHDPDAVRLSEIIEQLNERFGTNFAKADQLYFDQLEEEMADDEHLQEQAQANTLANFKFGFDRRFEDKVVERREANEDLFNRILEDKDFGDAVRDYLLRKVYERLQDAA
jgi:type I restriction enzyme R subunit